MKTDLSNLTATVTDGSKGFGAGTAEALKEKGVKVWITGRDENALNTTAKRLNVRAFRADVTSSSDWDALFKEVMDTTGRIDILVNNAGGAGKVNLIDEIDDDEITQNIAINLTGALLGCRRAAEVMKKQGSGTIINVSSTCA
nr:SDR family oxidoreductase [Deltaproteobacteria bacterium]